MCVVLLGLGSGTMGGGGSSPADRSSRCRSGRSRRLSGKPGPTFALSGSDETRGHSILIGPTPPNRPKLPPVWIGFRRRPTSAQIWGAFGQGRPSWLGISAKTLAPISADVGSTSANLDRIPHQGSTKHGPSPTPHTRLKCVPRVGQSWPNIGQLRPDMPRNRSLARNIGLGSRPTHWLGPEFGQLWPELDQRRPTSARKRLTLALCRPNLARCRPSGGAGWGGGTIPILERVD